jgi:glycosyltransferase involved in cell wall biosynthesis
LKNEVSFVGYIPQNEIQFWYKDCDIFVAPSIGGEGFGLTCLEANAMGKPVIGTEIFEKIGNLKNNYNGLTVPTKNPIAIANAIIKLKKSKKLRKKLGKNGISFAKLFDWNKAAEMTNEVYLT